MNFPARMAVTLGASDSTGCARQIAGANAKHRHCINIIFTVVLESESQDRLDAARAAAGGGDLIFVHVLRLKPALASEVKNRGVEFEMVGNKSAAPTREQAVLHKLSVPRIVGDGLQAQTMS
jgi:hypothetical protein